MDLSQTQTKSTHCVWSPPRNWLLIFLVPWATYLLKRPSCLSLEFPAFADGILVVVFNVLLRPSFFFVNWYELGLETLSS